MNKVTMKLSPEEMTVLQDYQTAINFLESAMGRYLGHVGVERHGLKDGKAYRFDPRWMDNEVDAIEVKEKKKLEK